MKKDARDVFVCVMKVALSWRKRHAKIAIISDHTFIVRRSYAEENQQVLARIMRKLLVVLNINR